jgi:hypothetical protein
MTTSAAVTVLLAASSMITRLAYPTLRLAITIGFPDWLVLYRTPERAKGLQAAVAECGISP